MSESKKTTPPSSGSGTSSTASISQSCSAPQTKMCELDKIQYKLDGVWKDVPRGGFKDIGKGTSITFKAIMKHSGSKWPSGYPKWEGDASGANETMKVTFNTSGARNISATCGNKITVPIEVDVANQSVDITWPNADYTCDNSIGDATTNEKPFVVEYFASADIDNNKWMLRVKKITGGAKIRVRMGSFKNPAPGVNITTRGQAIAAINDMLKESKTNGPASTWCTEAAIRAHEQWHYDEWKCSSNHYWKKTETAIEKLTVKYSDYIGNENNAVNAMKNTAKAIIRNFKQNKARTYWMRLGDNPGDRPYRAGGVVLNNNINAVRNWAEANPRKWVVPGGVNAAPQDNKKCYLSFPP